MAQLRAFDKYMNASTKCPKCEKTVDGVVMKRLNAVSNESPGGTIACVAYCCPNEGCACILGVESDPKIRDADTAKIQKSLLALIKSVDEEKAKSAARAQLSRHLAKPVEPAIA
jgi:hypothetical protein